MHCRSSTAVKGRDCDYGLRIGICYKIDVSNNTLGGSHFFFFVCWSVTWKFNCTIALWDVNMAHVGNWYVSLLASWCLLCFALKPYCSMDTQRACAHLNQVKWWHRRENRAFFGGTLFFHFLQHQNTRSVIPMFCANPCVLGWRTKGSSDTDSKAVQRKPVWAVLKVTAFLGCNTKQASCNSD